LIRLIALCLCVVLYLVVLHLVFQGLEDLDEPDFSLANAVTLSFAQMELQAPSAPQPDLSPEVLAKEEPEPEIIPDVEEADVALEKVEKEQVQEPEPQPEPMLESDAPVAQVTQQASAPTLVLVTPVDVQGWLLETIEKEKYYPPAAERFGLTGSFDLKIVVDADGTILSADVLEGRGHRILRKALEKMLIKIIGRNYGEPTGEVTPFEFIFEFE